VVSKGRGDPPGPCSATAPAPILRLPTPTSAGRARRCPQEDTCGLVWVGNTPELSSRFTEGWWDSLGNPPRVWPCIPFTRLQHPTAGPPWSTLLHHLVAPGEPGLGEAVAEADDGAMSHLHEVQLDAGLEGTRSPHRLGFTPKPPPTAGHHAWEPTNPSSRARTLWPLGWMEKTSTTEQLSSPRRRVDNPTSHPSAGRSFHGVQHPPQDPQPPPSPAKPGDTLPPRQPPSPYPDGDVSVGHIGWITRGWQWLFLAEKLRGEEQGVSS